MDGVRHRDWAPCKLRASKMRWDGRSFPQMGQARLFSRGMLRVVKSHLQCSDIGTACCSRSLLHFQSIAPCCQKAEGWRLERASKCAGKMGLSIWGILNILNGASPFLQNPLTCSLFAPSSWNKTGEDRGMFYDGQSPFFLLNFSYHYHLGGIVSRQHFFALRRPTSQPCHHRLTKPHIRRTSTATPFIGRRWIFYGLLDLVSRFRIHALCTLSPAMSAKKKKRPGETGYRLPFSLLFAVCS